MNLKKIVILSFLLLLMGSAAWAQSAKLKRANKAFEDLNYQEAIELYTQILEKEDVSEAKIRLAECYRKVSNTGEAEYWFGQVVRLPESEPKHKLYYGMALQANGKCELAKEWYEQYVQEVPDDLRGQYLVKACDYEEELRTKNNGVYEVRGNLPFNTVYDDFSPMFYKEGLIFTSEFRETGPVQREFAWTGRPFTDLFYVDAELAGDSTNFDYRYGRKEKFSDRLNSKYHDATVSFNADQSFIYFTRNNYMRGKTGKDDEGTVKLKIYYAESAGNGSWKNLEGLPFNSDEYSVAHPAITPGGQRLYFVSDMPGGFGGMDLYYTEQENGRWGAPINLGPSINTEGNELFPYYAQNQRLYFASDGHIGLGGLDVYYMEDTEGNGNAWGPIVNVGAPVNSNADDFGLIMNTDNTFGYFTSDRDGGQGLDDIYAFTRLAAEVEVYVYDEQTNAPISGAKVVLDCTGATLTTNNQGRAQVEMRVEQCCNFGASKEGYKDNSVEGCTIGLKPNEKTVVEVPLRRLIEFEIVGKILDQDSQEPIEGAIVELINDCGGAAPPPVVTDAKGNYRFVLGTDCCYEVKASKPGEYYANSAKDQCTRGLESSTILQANIFLRKLVSDGNASAGRPRFQDGRFIDPSTGQPYNSTTPDGNGWVYKDGIAYDENGNRVNISDFGFQNGITQVGAGQPNVNLLHIYYDFDQSYIRDDAEPELEKLLALLNNNPELVVEIGSHTDSRGSYRYNDRLSQRRAESVVRWLRDRGVGRDRLKPKGYGETVNVNQCSNNVPCSEEEHQYNRRTEFRVLGYYNSEGQYVEIESIKPDNVRVDPCNGCPF